MPEKKMQPVVITLADGDELWNAAKVGEVLGISPGTVWAYADKREPKNNPIPEPEGDPVALVVPDPATAAAVRLLMAAGGRVARGGSAPSPPQMWLGRKILAWQRTRKGRGRWRSSDKHPDGGQDT